MSAYMPIDEQSDLEWQDVHALVRLAHRVEILLDASSSIKEAQEDPAVAASLLNHSLIAALDIEEKIEGIGNRGITLPSDIPLMQISMDAGDLAILLATAHAFLEAQLDACLTSNLLGVVSRLASKITCDLEIAIRRFESGISGVQA